MVILLQHIIINVLLIIYMFLLGKGKEKKISEVDNKESFGDDKISYGFLKKHREIAKRCPEYIAS